MIDDKDFQTKLEMQINRDKYDSKMSIDFIRTGETQSNASYYREGHTWFYNGTLGKVVIPIDPYIV
jgi:hypothetical protein